MPSAPPPPPAADVLAVGLVTPVGSDAASTASAIRAGITGTSNAARSRALRGGLRVMGTVPPAQLPDAGPGLLAPGAGLDLLATDPRVPAVLVGGLDSYLEPPLLDQLDDQRRLLGAGAPDGFVPGEGAAFVLLAAPGHAARLGLASRARLVGV